PGDDHPDRLARVGLGERGPRNEQGGERCEASIYYRPCPPHSTFTPDALMTRAQRSWSFLRNAANSAGVSATVTAPSAFIRSCVSRLASDFRISSLKRPTTAAGVPAGASTPTQGAVSSKPGKPASAMVGTPGKSGWRTGVPTEMTFSFFATTWSAMPTMG